MLRPALPALAALLLALLAAAPASADSKKHKARFDGPHPGAPDLGEGMCHIPGPHVHAYAPHEEVLYVHGPGEAWVFVGDPIEYEPEETEPAVAYYGHHPLFWVGGDEHWCFISGPHRHWHAPPATVSFTVQDGAHFYVGAKPAWYAKRKHRKLDRYYDRVAYVRPAIVVNVAPVGYWGGLWIGERRGRGHRLGAPGINIHLGDDHRGGPRFIPPGHLKKRGKHFKGGKHWKGDKRGKNGKHGKGHK